MLNINKGAEPAFFAEFKKQAKPKEWKDLSPVTTELRQYLLKNEQTPTGVALCTYCEKKITLEGSQIDHIRPKALSGKYAHLFADYDNLTAICKSTASCGQTKDRAYDEDFINPVEENPADFMTYKFDTAHIIPLKEAVKKRVERTCEILRLNSCFELVNARKKILNTLFTKPDKGAAIVDHYKEFPSLIDFYRRVFLA